MINNELARAFNRRRWW